MLASVEVLVKTVLPCTDFGGVDAVSSILGSLKIPAVLVGVIDHMALDVLLRLESTALKIRPAAPNIVDYWYIEPMKN